ncbi:hypothetical protein QBC37DRAFT_179111 [Rhypophila decipiens]|uniref:RBR-type E3 ubiquitin transferase n=1 Tax=Rhypophila decipiens TaxID=261697 RepID=A0AAN6YGD3_9PEZI|nr:hypothetical protein QBC37DRAFT_179111 [Rhypophila decipiens]
MAFPSLSPADTMGMVTHPPELSEADYVREVLGSRDGSGEADMHEALVAKAASLQIELPLPGRPPTANAPNASDSEFADTVVSQHGRTASTSSRETTGSGLTSQTSYRSTVIPATLTESTNVTSRRRSKGLSFSQYEKYLSQVDPTANLPKFLNQPTTKPEWPIPAALIATGRKTSVREIKRTIAGKLRRKRQISSLTLVSCVCCREDFTQDHSDLRTLLCGHTYCQHCLVVMLEQSTTDESKMPPRCCTQPIPGAIIKTVLNRDDQQKFLKAVLQYSTPWETRIFCPNRSCGEFIPPRSKIDPKHPFEAVCKNCRTRVCITCKRNSHRLGQDCPDDWELDAVLKIGEKSGWRRCYKCRTLVELTQGCTHMTCRCKAQFCYICGAVWDPAVGCPNFCNGEEELERRRMAEEARQAEMEAEKQALEEAAAAERLAQQEAYKRSMDNGEFKAFVAEREAEIAKFQEFEQRAKIAMRARQSRQRMALREKYLDQMDKMKERHGKTEQHLDDRQIQAEIDLILGLEQSKKSINIQLKYMEAYCKGDTTAMTSTTASGGKTPPREVTQKHLDQLSEQYRIRDGMERRHQSQVNVLREKQAKRMEELVERHKKELETLADRNLEEIEDLEVAFTNEEEDLVKVFARRKAMLQRRAEIASEILRVELERKHGMRFTALTVDWPTTEDEEEARNRAEALGRLDGSGGHDDDDGLVTVLEE